MRAEVFVQWKGTDLCADLRCDCGETTHVDGCFKYSVTCPACKGRWLMPSILTVVSSDEETDA